MKDPVFKTQIDGSIRNIVNAFGLIDSTVAAKDQIRYHLFEAYKKGEDKTLFFDYRLSKTGIHSDYWNPTRRRPSSSHTASNLFWSRLNATSSNCGLPARKKSPSLLTSVSFIYVLLRVANVENHSIDSLKAEIT